MSGQFRTVRKNPHDKEWYGSLFDNNPLPMWIYDRGTLRFLAVNDAAVQKYGYSQSEFLQMTLRDIRPEEELERLEKHLSAKRADLQQSGVWVHRSKDGSEYYTEITSHSIEFEGRPAALVIVHDVTLRQKLQEDLRRNEERIHSLFDNAAIGIYRTTPDGRLLACNPAGMRMLGYNSFDEIADIDLDNATAGPTYERREFCNRLDHDGVITGLESVWIRKDGSAMHVRESASAIRDESGNILYYDGTLEDITKQKNAEEALQLAQAIVDHASIGIFILGPDGSIQSVNERACKTLGYTRQELNSLNILDIDPLLSREKWSDHRKMVEEEKVKRFESLHRRRDGSTLPVEIMVNLLEFNGNRYSVSFARDITELKEAEEAHKNAEAALHESERRFRELYDDAPVGYHELDNEGRIVRVNHTELNLLGYSAEEMLGHYVWEFVKDHDMSHSAVLKKLSGEQAAGQSYEREFCRKDGSVVQFLVEECFVCDSAKHLVGIRTTLQDITERKRAEEALKQAEEHLRNLFENIAIGLYRTTPDGKVLFANPALVRMLGYTSFEELSERNLEEEGSERSFTRNEFKTRIERDGQVAGLETRWKKSDGSFAWVRESARVVRDDRGTVLYYEGTAEDITYRKEMEEALKRSEEQYRSFFEEDVTADLLTLPDGKMIACNPAFVRMFGFESMKEALSTNMTELYPAPEARAELIHLIREKKKLTEYELELRKRGGNPVYVRANYVGIFNEVGELVQIKQYLIDETERKLLEQQLIQAQKLDGIGRLAGGVAHDYNNILGVVLGYGELVRNKLNHDDPVSHQIEAILNAANRGRDLTRQLLAFARREIVSPKVLNLNSAVESIQTMLQRLIGENISLVLSARKDLWNTKIDPTQFDQIMINLATNARDAIEDIGTITVETFNERLDEQYVHGHREFAPGEYVVLSFSDDGKGMDKETQEKMFEPFFTTKAKGRGTGLGLSTVYGIAKQNGGNINVYSEPGRGTTIKIYFPRFYGKKEISEEKSQDESLYGHETILVVEDQADLLELSKNSLEEYGYKVIAAWTPREAVLLCEQYSEEINLLLTDVIMPEMNGKELRDKITAVKPGIRTLFMSGYTADVIAHRGILDEGIQFIQKPFTPRTLAKKVRDVLRIKKIM